MKGRSRAARRAPFGQSDAVATPEPIRLVETAAIDDAIRAMPAEDRMTVVIVDGNDRLIGIVTDRDLLGRCWSGRDGGRTHLSEVMTRDPETLKADDRICYAVNRMWL